MPAAFRKLDAVAALTGPSLPVPLQASDHDGPADAGVDREELAALMPLLGLERFDRRACNQVLRGLAGPPVVSSGKST